MSSILIRNIHNLCGISESQLPFKKGQEMAVVQTIENAYLLCEYGRISQFGQMAECPERADTILDATDKLVMPAWCDSHTHLVFPKSREEEFVYRIKGLTYTEIAEKGGGILNSARKMQAIDENELYEKSAQRLENLIRLGTGAIEMKSGYGLTFESELKILRVIRALKENYKVALKSTFLGAHAFPLEYKENNEAYIDILINEMMPQIQAENLADYCDVFCEKGFFNLKQTERIFTAATKFGMKLKLHANQLSNSGALQLGVLHSAVSVDHLEEIGDEEINILKTSKTIPTVLPSCSYFLNIPYAPARKMIDSDLGIAIASDYNPGTTPSGNVPFLLSLSCSQMRLTPEEAFNAVTINGAHAMELDHDLGSITKGKIANLIITKTMQSLAYIPYAFGDNHIDQVILQGEIFR